MSEKESINEVLVALQFNDSTTKEEVIQEIVSQLKKTGIKAFYKGNSVEGSLLILKNDCDIEDTIVFAAADYFEMDGNTFKEIS